jgi:hypothetical protein
MSVFAVPRSIARSFENRPFSQSKIIASRSSSRVQAFAGTPLGVSFPGDRRGPTLEEALGTAYPLGSGEGPAKSGVRRF